MLERGIVIANGKGGVGKSSVAAGLSATAAGMGWRTLAIDLDPQGNLGQDLGYTQAGLSDGGEGLLRAFEAEAEPQPILGVRDNLDALAAGPATDVLVDRLFDAHARDGRAGVLVLRDLVVELGRSYDLVVIDTPPTSSVLLDVAFATGRFLCCPVRFDRGSIDGLRRVLDRRRRIRAEGVNPHLEVLGVLLFGFARHERRMLADTRRHVREALVEEEVAGLFDTYVREARKAAGHMRTHGVVASEYYFAAANGRRVAPTPGSDTFARNAEGLAEDYWELTREILTRLKERLSVPIASGVA